MAATLVDGGRAVTLSANGDKLTDASDAFAEAYVTKIETAQAGPVTMSRGGVTFISAAMGPFVQDYDPPQRMTDLTLVTTSAATVTVEIA